MYASFVVVCLGVGTKLETDPAYCVHSYKENLIKATLPLSYTTSGKQIWILHSVSPFKHSACNLLGGKQWKRLMREGEHILTFSLASFILMHLISPPSSFVEHLSFPINLHQSLYPCWVKNCTHYFVMWYTEIAFSPLTNVR